MESIDYAAMTDEALLGLLATEEDRLPGAAVDEIVSRGARMIGLLTQIVTAPENWQADLPAWWAPIHATFLLGAIGGPGAIGGLLAAAKGSDAYDVDWVFEVLPSIFGRLGTTARPPLLQWLQDARHPPFVRSLVAQGLAATTLTDPEGAGEVYRHLSAVFADSKDDLLKDLLGNILLDFQVAECKEALLEYARRREAEAESKFFLAFSVDDVERAFSDPFPGRFNHYTQDWLRFYDPGEIAARQARWAEEERKRQERETRTVEAAWEAPIEETQSQPFVRTGPKVGRNDPCPCGSGKKYKKCCLGKGEDLKDN